MKLFLKIFVAAALVMASQQAMAQRYNTSNKKAIKLFEEGYELGMKRKDEEAIRKFEAAIKIDSSFAAPYQFLAEIYFDRKDLAKALASYAKVVEIDPARYGYSYKDIGDLNAMLENYTAAVTAYEKLLEYRKLSEEERLNATAVLDLLRFRKSLVDNPFPFTPVNLGSNVNSEFGEYHPTTTVDESYIIYTVLEANKFNCVNGNYEENFYTSQKTDSGWSMRQAMPGGINSECNEGGGNLSPDGNFFFFQASHRPGEIGRGDLYFSQRNGNTWSDPFLLAEPLNSKHYETQPCFSSDGRTLYFVSDRPGGFGGEDIYMSTLKTDGKWTEPINLGSNINTAGSERSPFIHPDNRTFYFTSNKHPGMGGYDIFISHRGENGIFDEVTNIGYPINTPLDERSLMITPDGTAGYFASENKKGLGSFDLYRFELPEALRPEPVTYLKGKIIDKETGKPVQADFKLTDLSTGIVMINSGSDAQTGSFLVTLPTDKSYALTVSAANYLFYSETFQLPETGTISKPYTKDILIQPIKKGNSVVLRNVFFDTDKYDLKKESATELTRLAELLQANGGMKIEISGHTDNQGSKSHNQMLSENRAKAVYDFLVTKGISKDRLTYKGYGDSKPIEDNATEQGRANNRRTEFVVTDL